MDIQGTNGPDILVGTNASDRIYGLGGDDTLNGGKGADTLDGGSGNDTAVFYWQDHFIDDDGQGQIYADIDASANVVGRLTDDGGWLRIRGPGIADSGQPPLGLFQTLVSIENLSTGFGDDGLFGNDAANILSGGSGDDFLSGGRGRDTLLGGKGDDTLAGDGGTDHLDGGEGFDIADYTETNADISVDLAQSRVSFPGQNWAPELLISIEGVITGSGNDLLLGTGQGDYLAGSDGNDTLRGFGGNDTLDGGYGTDVLQGGGGSDTADYSSVGSDVRIRIGAQRGEIYDRHGILQTIDSFQSIENGTGGSGDDTLLGNSGANILDGGDGRDRIEAREADDTIFLSSGYDSVDGGTGTDTLVIDHTDWILGGAIYEYYAVDGDESNTFISTREADTYVDLSSHIARGGGAFTGTTNVRNVENVEIRTALGDDIVIGSEPDNEIHVGIGANFVRGKGGNDAIYGGSYTVEDFSENVEDVTGGTFVLDYGSRDEQLYGDAGNDTLYGSGLMDGGDGDDRLVCTEYDREVTMAGGLGADAFEFSGRAKEIDSHTPRSIAMIGRITDFDPTQADRIEINGKRRWAGEDEDQRPYVEVWQEDGNTIVFYRNEENPEHFGPDGLHITLADYTGPIGQDDVIFI